MSRTKIGPGIYDVDGELHVVVPEILLELGMEVNQENVDAMTEQLARQAAELVPGMPVDVDEGPMVDVGLADGTVVEAVVDDDPPRSIDYEPSCTACDDSGCPDCRPYYEDPPLPWEFS
jgi:hypothetical protein